jgi:hypothetical protein
MKQLQTAFCIILIMCCITSCQRFSKPNHQKEYEKFLTYFELSSLVYPDSIVSFYPEITKYASDTCLLRSFMASDAYRGDKPLASTENFKYYGHIVVYEFCDISYMHNYIDTLLYNYPNSYRTSIKKCLLLKRIDVNNRVLFDESISEDQIENKSIVPDFFSWINFDELQQNDSHSAVCLDKNIEAITILSGDQNVLPLGYEHNSDSYPLGIRHGYRSGIAYCPDDKYVIFFTIAW